MFLDSIYFRHVHVHEIYASVYIEGILISVHIDHIYYMYMYMYIMSSWSVPNILWGHSVVATSVA